MVGGILGSVLPVLPGPPLSYTGLFLLHLTVRHSFSREFLVGWAVVTVLVSLLDYAIPVWSARRFGGSRRGGWGIALGMLAGLFFFPPWGMIIGALAGAIAGELAAGRKTGAALRSGLAAFLGVSLGTLLKLTAAGWMAWHFVRELASG